MSLCLRSSGIKSNAVLELSSNSNDPSLIELHPRQQQGQDGFATPPGHAGAGALRARDEHRPVRHQYKEGYRGILDEGRQVEVLKHSFGALCGLRALDFLAFDGFHGECEPRMVSEETLLEEDAHFRLTIIVPDLSKSISLHPHHEHLALVRTKIQRADPVEYLALVHHREGPPTLEPCDRAAAYSTRQDVVKHTGKDVLLLRIVSASTWSYSRPSALAWSKRERSSSSATTSSLPVMAMEASLGQGNALFVG